MVNALAKMVLHVDGKMVLVMIIVLVEEPNLKEEEEEYTMVCEYILHNNNQLH